MIHGDFKESGFIFAVKPSGEIDLLFEGNDLIKAPNGVLVLDDSKLLIVDWAGDLLEGRFKKPRCYKIR